MGINVHDLRRILLVRPGLDVLRGSGVWPKNYSCQFIAGFLLFGFL